MTQWLRQATASQEILLGPFLDSTDGNTQETALTIAASDIKIWKEGLTSESNKNLGGATHIANGRYSAVLDNTDTATAGKLEINVHVAGALAVRREYMVLPANVYDALVYGTDFLDVSAVQLAGQTITAGAGVTFPSSVASPTNITAGTLTTVTNLTNLPAITAGWITAAGIAASALNGKGDWNIGKTCYSLTQGFPSNFSSLSITAGGLVDITQAAADKAWGTAARVLTAGTNIALAKGTGITGFNDLDAAGVAAATWNAATASYGSAGSYGLLVETNLDAQVSTVGGGSLTAAAIADAVWDEVLSGHLTAGSTGASLNGAGSAGDPWTAILGGYGAGSAGKIVYDNLNATVSSRATQTSVDTVDDFLDTEIAAIKAKTDNLPTDPADASDIAAAFSALSAKVDTVDDFLDTEIAAIKTKTDFLPSATAGAAGGLFIAGSNAATTVNFTGTITTVTNLTNLPSIPAGWLTAAGIASGALNGKGDWNIGKTGYSLTQAFPTNFSSLSITAGGLVDPVVASVSGAVWNAATASYGSAGSYGLLMETNLDAPVSSAGGGGGTADWTADEKTVIKAVLGIPGSGTTPADPTTGILDTIRDNAVAIKAKTDNLPADPADASDIAAAFAVTNGKIDTVDDLIDTEIAAIKAETASIQVDTNDIQARLPAALVGGRMDSNLSAISNSTTTMAAFNRAVKGNVIGTVGAGSTTTSIVSSSVTPAGSVADKFKGRLIVFADDTTTANLRGQATDITANTSAAAPTFTVTALTTAPVSGDTFVII